MATKLRKPDNTYMKIEEIEQQLTAVAQAVPGGMSLLEPYPPRSLSSDLDLNGHQIIGRLENETFILDGGLLG